MAANSDGAGTERRANRLFPVVLRKGSGIHSENRARVLQGPKERAGTVQQQKHGRDRATETVESRVRVEFESARDHQFSLFLFLGSLACFRAEQTTAAPFCFTDCTILGIPTTAWSLR